MSENNLTSLCITAVLLAAIAAVGFGVTLGANSMRNCAATCGSDAVARFTGANVASNTPAQCVCARREVAP